MIFGDYKKFRKLQEDVADLQSTVRRLELEFSRLYDNVRTTVAKWAKRIERASEAETAENGDSQLDSGSDLGTTAHGLTDRQRKVNAEILRRRQ